MDGVTAKSGGIFFFINSGRRISIVINRPEVVGRADDAVCVDEFGMDEQIQADAGITALMAFKKFGVDT